MSQIQDQLGGTPNPGRKRWLVAGLAPLAAVAVFVVYANLSGPGQLSLDEITSRLGMDCVASEIDPSRRILGARLADILPGPTFDCDWNGANYEVTTRQSLESMVETLVAHPSEAIQRQRANLVESCQSLIFNANLDNQVRQKLLLASGYAFVNFSGVDGLRQAMESEGVGLSAIPSACDELSSNFQTGLAGA